MALVVGTRLGPYEILSAIGAGGMGEVYRARDTRLDRIVALKIIQPAAAADQEMRERFEREARAISSLDHPHICVLYDVCREGDLSFLVMQYLEGETLADRLARAGRPASDPNRPGSGPDSALPTMSRGPMPFETTMKYAAEIAQALDAAHRRGIVHRDLKPGNIMLTKTGTKLLDFGLAKLARPETGAHGFTVGVEATRTAPLTGQGTILGTLHYMSPEQVEGRDVDARADIHAFGAVLFEMLSGRRAFDGQSQAGVIAAILAGDSPTLQDLADTRATLPVVARRALDRLIARCLAKHPDDRWQSAADLAAEVQWIIDERLRAVPETTAVAPVVDVAANARARRRERTWMGVAFAAILALGVIGYRWYPRKPSPPAPISFTLDLPAGEELATGPGLASISADGRRLAFVTAVGTRPNHLWVRSLDSLAAQPLSRADGAWQPVWSPDGRSIAFTENTGGAPLRKVDVDTGSVMTLAPAANGRVGWSRRGVIVFESSGKLMAVPEGGGTPTLVMDLDPALQEISLSWPTFLPDGRRYLFLSRSADASKTGIYLASIDAPGRTFVVGVRSSVDYANGYLFYQRDGTLMAHPFDAEAGRLAGDAFPAIENVRYNANNGRAAIAVSESGVLVYTGGSNIVATARRLLMIDRSGKSQKQIGPAGIYSAAMLSPTGRQAVVSVDSADQAKTTLSLLDLERGLLTPFTIGDVDERRPIWSPDGLSIVFSSVRNGVGGLYRRSAAGGATKDEQLFSSPEPLGPSGFSPAGDVLLFTRGAGASQRVWALPLNGDRKAVEAIPGVPMAQYQATFSPDGKWIAFGAGPSQAQGEVYIQPYPADDRRVQISTSAGRVPYWTADGRHIIYRTATDDVMSVELTPEGRTFRPSTPVKLFNSRHATPGNWSYSMDARGEKFLIVVPPEQTGPEPALPLTIIVNWIANLKKP